MTLHTSRDYFFTVEAPIYKLWVDIPIVDGAKVDEVLSYVRIREPAPVPLIHLAASRGTSTAHSVVITVPRRPAFPESIRCTAAVLSPGCGQKEKLVRKLIKFRRVHGIRYKRSV